MMIKILFLDNFRGFSNTTVRLLDVNFLVGENSTGKTSLLNLLQVISDASFFMGPILGATQEARFGHFREIVSAHSADRSYFRVGLMEERELRQDKRSRVKTVTGMLLTYIESSGVPKLKQITYATADHSVTLQMQGSKALFKMDESDRIDIDSDVSGIFRKWQNLHVTPGEGWAELSMPPWGSQQNVPIFFLLQLIMEQAKVVPEKRKSFSMMYPTFGNRLIWIAPIRTKPQRTYDEPHTSFSSEGIHTPYTIRRMLASKTEAKRFGAFMKKVGKASGLFDSIAIKRYAESDDAPFEVDAIVDGQALNLSWVGYGVSQSLPIFVELLDSPKGSWFAIQQPEVHLHPRAQASLGDIFFEMATRDDKRFVIETHSDFAIDRFRMNYRQKNAKKPASQILFFERVKSQNTVVSVPIDVHGELANNQPEAYRRFFLKEEMRMLGI